MAIKLSDSIRVGQQKPLEDKYFNELVPYTSTTQVNTLLPKAVRHIGLTVNINGEEYWYKDGIDDYDLVFKSNHKTIEVTKEELYNDLIPNEKLEPNRLYKITGVESWCFSQHLIKAIYLKAITNNTLESEGVGEFYTPKYNNSDSNLGIWKGELLANGMIDSLSYNVGDKVIWGNLFWENISGNVGTNIKEYYDEDNYNYITPKLQSWLSNDWTLITPNNDESLYNVQFDKINYDFENDYISYREDRFGNKNELSYEGLISLFPYIFIADNIDSTFIYYVNSIALFQWGRNANFNNNISESIVLNCNYNHSLFRDNNVLENSIICNNNFFNVQFYNNNIKKSTISYNYLKNNGGIINNDIEDSQVYNNKYYIEISDNKLRNGSSIANNTYNEITVYNRISTITKNNLDNNSTINYNNFVEEGKGTSGYSKGINDNILNNNCNINSNIVKNSSRIFGHTLEYYSTINGNTLDTDSNIYNNQLVQNGKIDNNIITGHGRIYGNQLDRQSEITNCKLRISPATSYATTMKSNRLFAGKIQNVDFGDIVNPVGTNPNDINFSGNSLSECIIENNSIIKDLTFPNHGGVGIQFVKMNGYSEFKNITVNDDILSVELINTVFDETSDYSKIIQGAGYNGQGFTKYYIDNVLLQDRFDNKLDKGTYTGNAQDLKNEINNVQIGGRNYFANSEIKSLVGYVDYFSTLSIVDNSLKVVGNSEYVGFYKQYTVPLEAQRDITISFLLKNNKSNIITVGGFPNGNELVTFGTAPANSGWVKITKTFKAKDFQIDQSNTWSIYIFSYGNTDFQIKNLKVEYGNKSTDWTPAPEDKQDNLQDITGNIGVGKTDASATEKLDVNGKVLAIGFKTPTGKATQALTSDGGTFDLTTVANENKKATITVELISQLTTNFYAPNALIINSTALISGSGTLTLKVNDVAYTLGNLIPQGAKITAETTSQSVYNLISVYE